MSIKVKITGKASNKTIKELDLSSSVLEKKKMSSLMDYLRSQSIPIASGCYSEGVCNKCQIELNNGNVLSCRVKLKNLTEKSYRVKIGYL